MDIISKLADVIGGRVTLFVPAEYCEAFREAVVSQKITAYIRESKSDNGIIAEMRPEFVKKIASTIDILNIKVYIINIKGFCAILPWIKRRMGAVVGAALFFFILWFSSLWVWRVDVVGAVKVDRAVITEALRCEGVGVGSRISDIDAFSVGNRLLLNTPQLSWVSLDVTGTTVTLTVRETVEGEKKDENDTSLLIASESGVVHSILVYSGTAAVKPGSVVKAGDALINGLISGSGLQYSDPPVLRIGKARGSVLARVERTLSVYVPFEETVYTPIDGKVYSSKLITVFGKSFLVGDGEPEGNYSVSEKSYCPRIFGDASLPLTVKETVWTPNEPSVLTRDPESAERLGREKAEKAVCLGVGDGELLGVEYSVAQDGMGCTVTAVYRCIAEIAVSADIGRQDG